MLRLLLGSNSKLLNSIASKAINKCAKKNFGCKTAKAKVSDFVVYQLENGKLQIHINGDIEISKDELLRIINDKIGEDE